jgi:hypothetical protein
MVEIGSPVSMSRISQPLARNSSMRPRTSSPVITATLKPGACCNTALAQATGFTPPALAITLMLPARNLSFNLPISGGKSLA